MSLPHLLPQIVTESVPGVKSLELADRLAFVESPDTTFLSAEFPIFWESAQGCLVTDVDGNSYLDATSSFGALSVGHTHPRVVDAVTKQARLLIHGMGDVHPSRVKVELLEKIARYSPIPSPRIILGQSGAESVEAAVKTAHLATGKAGVLAFDGGYHGLSYGALEPTARAAFRDPFKSQRGQFAQHLPYGCSLDRIESALTQADSPIGAVIVEPIQGRGGIRIPPDGWLTSLSTLCQLYRALFILDEIYTGWGRTGSLFACQHEGLIPDLICVGKAMGGGMPISACIGKSEIIEQAWPKSTGEALHTSTFLGHPLACAGAIAAIETIDKEDLVRRSKETGALFLEELQLLAERFPEKIVDVRGRGLMIGIELNSGASARGLMLRLLRKGLIVLLAGDEGSVLELTPPLIISQNQVEWCLQTLSECLGDQ